MPFKVWVLVIDNAIKISNGTRTGTVHVNPSDVTRCLVALRTLALIARIKSLVCTITWSTRHKTGNYLRLDAIFSRLVRGVTVLKLSPCAPHEKPVKYHTHFSI